jgi:hypothetical protein
MEKGTFGFMGRFFITQSSSAAANFRFKGTHAAKVEFFASR